MKVGENDSMTPEVGELVGLKVGNDEVKSSVVGVVVGEKDEE